MKLKTYAYVVVATITLMFLVQYFLHRDDTVPTVEVEASGEAYASREARWRKTVEERDNVIGRLRATLAGRTPVLPDTIVVYDTIVEQDTVYLGLSMDSDGQLELVTGVAVDSVDGFTPTREVYGLGNCDDGFTLVPGALPVCDEARAGHLWLGVYAGGAIDSLVVALPAPWLEPTIEWQPSYRSPWRAHIGYDVFDRSVRVGVARGLWLF
jgi:hypothetical protein